MRQWEWLKGPGSIVLSIILATSSAVWIISRQISSVETNFALQLQKNELTITDLAHRADSTDKLVESILKTQNQQNQIQKQQIEVLNNLLNPRRTARQRNQDLLRRINGDQSRNKKNVWTDDYNEHVFGTPADRAAINSAPFAKSGKD